MTTPAPQYGERSAGTCYRHPDRQSWVLCQRCGRTICPECQTQAAVGVQCPECVGEARAAYVQTQRAQRGGAGTRLRRMFAPGSSKPVVTWTIAAICVAVWLLELIPTLSTYILYWFGFFPPVLPVMPWQMITSGFVHSPGSIFHIAFNMWALLVIGPILEHLLGRARFLTLYLLSILGGSTAVLLLAPTSWVVGASGAIFGLFAAYFIVMRGLGGNPTQILIIIGLNLVIGFLPGMNISWQAHVGGLIIGGVLAWIFMATRGPRNRRRQLALVGLVIGALIVTILTTSFVLFNG